MKHVFRIIILLLVHNPTSNAGMAFMGLQGLGVDYVTTNNLQGIVTSILKDIGGPTLLTPEQVQQMLADPDLGTLKKCIGRTSCLVDFGAMYNCHVILTGSVAKMGEANVVALKLVDVLSDKEKGSIQQTVRGSDQELMDVLRRAVLRLLKPKDYVGSIALAANIEGAEIKLDGNVVGITPLHEPLKNLFVGTHALIVSKDGYYQYNALVDVEVNDITKIMVELKPFEVSAHMSGQASINLQATSKRGLSKSDLIGTLTFTSIGVVAGTIAGVYGLLGNSDAHEADDVYQDLYNSGAIHSNEALFQEKIDARDKKYMIAMVSGSISALCLAGAALWLGLGWESGAQVPNVQPIVATSNRGVSLSVRWMLP